MSFGVTPEGFNAKLFQDVRDEIVDAISTQFAENGEPINFDPDSIFSLLVDIFGERESLIWELAQAVFSSQYPDSASGVSLDNVASIIGLSRQPATASTALLTLTGAPGTPIPASSVVSAFTDPTIRLATDSVIQILTTAAVAALVQVDTVTLATTYTATINLVAHDYVASDTTLSIIGVSTGSETFTVANDHRSKIRVGDTFRVSGSTGNDGTFTVASVTLVGGDTVIAVNEDVTDSTVDGQVNITPIIAVDTSNEVFTVPDDRTDLFQVGESFTVAGSTGNDGTFTVLSVALVGGDTEITVNEDVTSAVADGRINVDDDERAIANGLTTAINLGSQPVTASVTASDELSVKADDITVTFGMSLSALMSFVSASVTVGSTAETAGATAIPANTLTVIETPVGGWDSVTNENDAITGRDIETDTALRQRYKASLQVVGAGTVDAIRSKLLQVSGVSEAFVLENTSGSVLVENFAITDVDTGAKKFTLAGDLTENIKPTGPNATFIVVGSTGNDGTFTVVTVSLVSGDTVITVSEVVPSAIADGNIVLETLPAHSFESIVDGGTDQDIADTIFANKPAGIETFGVSNSETVIDSQGNPQTVEFSRPSLVSVNVQIDYTRNTEEDLPVEQEIIDAVKAFGKALKIGNDVIIDKIEATAILSTTGIKTVVAKVNFVGGPFPPTSTSDIAISKRQQALFADVAVTDVT